jgi:DNA invertase Pin-like site-specific DNA recombinase
MIKAKRVALYVRVSTDDQTVDNQLRDLQTWAERCGHTIVRVFEDSGISGATGRDKRPGFDAMLKAAIRREFDMLAVWSSDRLGRSLQHLIEVLQTIRDTGAGLYIHTQALDTTTPSGRAMFGMLAVFGEFEREMIVARVNAGIARAKAKGTKSGKAIGRPRVAKDKEAAVRAELDRGTGILKTAKLLKLGTGTVQKIKNEMMAG